MSRLLAATAIALGVAFVPSVSGAGGSEDDAEGEKREADDYRESYLDNLADTFHE